MTVNEKLCKFISKNYFFKMFLLIFFIDTIISLISSTQIACDVMCVQYVQKQPPEVFFKKDNNKRLFCSIIKTQMFSCEISKILRIPILKNICGRLLIKWYVIKFRKNKSRVSHLNQIWFKYEKDRLEKDTISAGPK